TEAGFGADALEHFADIGRVQGSAEVAGEDQPGVLPVLPGRIPLASLAVLPGAQCVDGSGGEGEGAARSFGLGVAVGADRPLHSDMRRGGRAGSWVAIQVDVS